MGPQTSAALSSPSRLARFSKGRLRTNLWGFFFISPWIIGFLAFTLVPMVTVVPLSFTKYGVLDTPRWIGATNYTNLFTDDPLFWTSLWNTVYYTVIAVPLHLIAAFLLAILLNRKIIGVTFFRTVLYLPSIVPSVASIMVWVWLLNPQLSPLRIVFDAIGVQQPNWLGSETWSKPGLIIMSMWQIGGLIVIFLAGLQGIPEHLYEAASIDGATPIRQFFAVTIPMMTPAILLNLLMQIIAAFQVLQSALIATNGGPLNSTLFYLLYLYRNALTYFKMGYASAMAVLLFIIVVVLSVLVMRSSSRWVYYESE